MLKVNNRNTKAKCKIRLKLTPEPEQRHWCRFGVFIVNFEHISHLVLVSLRIQSECEEIRTRITPNTALFTQGLIRSDLQISSFCELSYRARYHSLYKAHCLKYARIQVFSDPYLLV